ncbi:hypothetical protein FNV43_RR01274 [Rhamnella rubrinervis]|uniref:Uncharacterized protein n=1 Tax=Rhamnella rubrinervis TaxID=2594499 RepID=A0A8K0MT67_9ROSA|nr:hypothetical protein FNV43_RR01274 [Rhamnella rubrinervis]
MENAMENGMEILNPSFAPIDLQTIRRRVRELEDMLKNWEDDDSELCPSDAEKLLKDCVLQFQSRVEELVSEGSDVGFSGENDLDVYLQCLSEELKSVEAKSTKISNEIEVLTRTYSEDCNRLGTDLEGLKSSLEFNASQDLKKTEVGAIDGCSTNSEAQLSGMNIYGDQALESTLQLLELEDQIEKKSIMLKTLQDLDRMCKRSDALEQVDNAFTGLKVIAFDENCIRLSLQTYLPKLQGVMSLQYIEVVNEPSELNHELLIEVVEGGMDIKNVEIFPNDVYMDDILEASRHFSKSSLHWFVTKVQDRIVLCTMRLLVVKSANKSRLFLEYLDKDEMIVAHMAEGVDAFIKVSQGWPVSSHPLNLISLKSSDQHSKGISSSFLSKVKEGANSLDLHTRQNLLSFVDAIEKILVDHTVLRR